MTGFYDAVLQRHSVRRYSSTPVPDDKLHRVMEATRLCPSGGNRQGHRFIIARDRSLRMRLVAAAGNQDWMAEAPLIIACCGKPELPVGDGDDFGRTVNVLRWGSPAVEMMEGMEDKGLLSLLMGNGASLIPGTHLTLAAAAEGLGTCWIGYLDIEAASRHLRLPDDWKCYFLMTLGYPSEPVRHGGHDRMHLEDMVFMDSWGERWPRARESSPLPERKR